MSLQINVDGLLRNLFYVKFCKIVSHPQEILHLSLSINSDQPFLYTYC